RFDRSTISGSMTNARPMRTYDPANRRLTLPPSAPAETIVRASTCGAGAAPLPSHGGLSPSDRPAAIHDVPVSLSPDTAPESSAIHTRETGGTVEATVALYTCPTANAAAATAVVTAAPLPKSATGASCASFCVH